MTDKEWKIMEALWISGGMTVGAVTLTCCGFVQLIFNCMPFNKYRAKVVGFSFLGYIAAVFFLYGLNYAGFNYLSFEIGLVDGVGFGTICLGIVLCVGQNLLYRYLLRRLRSGGKANPFFSTDDIYSGTTEGEDTSDKQD